MSRKRDSIEKVDEAIEKLQQNNKEPKQTKTKRFSKDSDVLEEKEEMADDFIKTKEVKTLEDTDTKVFDKDSETLEIDDSEEDTTERTVVDENEMKFDDLDNREMSNTFVEGRLSSLQTKHVQKEKSPTRIILMWVLGFLILAVIVLGVILLLDKFGDDKKNKPVIVDQKELTEKEKESIINKFGSDLEVVISKELTDNKKLLSYDEAVELVEVVERVNCSVHEVYDDGKIFLNKCSVNGIVTKYSYGTKRVINANAVSVYVHKSSNKATLVKPGASEVPLYDEYKVDCGDEFSNQYLLSETSNYIVYVDSKNKVNIKNFKTDEKILDNITYSEVLPIRLSNGSYDTSNVLVQINKYWGVYKYEGGQVVSPMYSNLLSDSSGEIGMRTYVNALKDNLLIAYDGSKYGIINYTNNKSIIPLEYAKLRINNTYIMAKKSTGDGDLFDFTGKEYLSNMNVLDGLENKYFVVKNGENINILEIDGKKLYDYGIINNIGELYSGNVSDGKVTFSFSELNSTGKCVNIIYEMNNNSGSYTSGNECSN